jgi:hypothetical protein
VTCGFSRKQTDEDIEAWRYRKADALFKSMTYGEMPWWMCENCTPGFQF